MRLIICLSVTLMLLIGIVLAQSTNQAGTKTVNNSTLTQEAAMAGLNELPRGAAVALRPVPDSQLLATQIRQIPPAPQGTPQPLCAARRVGHLLRRDNYDPDHYLFFAGCKCA